MRSLTAKWFFEMAGIPSAAFIFDGDLATELETYAEANIKLLSRVANIALASSNTFSESGLSNKAKLAKGALLRLRLTTK